MLMTVRSVSSATLLTQHSRVPFAPENFKTDALYRSYAAEWLPAASGKGTAHQAFSTPLNKKN